MPRPRVDPQNRKRAAMACDHCKASKRRCDGKLPCSQCSNKGVGDLCCYRHQHDLPGLHGRQAPSPGPGRLREPPATPDSVLASQITAISSPRLDENTAAVSAQRPVMLTSFSGEQVFIGNTAALSFLRFLQSSLKPYGRNTGFADGRHSHHLFEAADTEVYSDSFPDTLTDKDKKELVQLFYDASSGFLDIFTQDELEALLQQDSQPVHEPNNDGPRSRSERAALVPLHLAIAIGAQCKGNDIAAVYFSHARKLAFEGLLEDPSVNLVKSFLLMAFYMLGACRRNSAFMYIGVAARSADILGLQASAHYRHLSEADVDNRLRTAASLRVLDLVCSAILGRHASAWPLKPPDAYTEQLSRKACNVSHRSVALGAVYESATVLARILDRMGDSGSLDDESAVELLRVLRDWSNSLPVELRQQQPTASETLYGNVEVASRRETVIGNIHVAGTYYFGILLVTRQYLVGHITSRLGWSGPEGPQLDTHRVTDKARAPELAASCVEAATFLAEMCYEASQENILLGNMCILKAWLFAAGLVLGFASLDDSGIYNSPGAPFHSAMHVLHKLSRLSAQAEQYHRILTSFSQTIQEYKIRREEERRVSGGTLVQRIFSLGTTPPSAGQSSLAVPELSSPGASEVDSPRPETQLSPPLSHPEHDGHPWLPGMDDDLIQRLFWDNTTELIDLIPQ